MRNAAALLIIAALTIQACTYAISRDIKAKADKTITFPMILSDPDTFKGKLVIMGGTIATLKNTKTGSYLEVVQKELDYWGKPERTETSSGRFIVFTPAYLDSWVYSAGRDITVAAEIAGTRHKANTEFDFKHPLLISKELKLWDRPEARKKDPLWWDPLNDPYGRE